MRLLMEMTFIGIIMVIIGLIIKYILSMFLINHNNVFILTLFLTGFLGHLIFELSGLNTTYCKEGRACLKKN